LILDRYFVVSKKLLAENNEHVSLIVMSVLSKQASFIETPVELHDVNTHLITNGSSH